MERPPPGQRLDNWRLNWSVRRVLFAAGAVAAIATALALALPVWAAAVLTAVLAVSLLIPRFRWPFWLICAVTAAVFLLSATGYRYVYIRPLSALSGRQDTLTGQVVATPVNGSMYTLRVTQSGCVPAGTRVALYCPSELAPNLYDTVEAQVELLSAEEATFRSGDTATYLFAFLTQEDEEHIRVTDPEGFSWLYCLAPLRERLQTALRAVLPGEEGALLTALCLGIRHDLSAATTAAFRDSGLTHLLVVSGLHLTLVAVSVRRLLRRLGVGYRLSAILTMPVILAFMLLVGFTPSVCRAGVMCLVWLCGYLVSRRPDGLNSLGLSAMLLLLENPYTLLNAGFQLSFMATAGILLIAPRLMRKFPMPERFSTPVAWAAHRIGYYVAGMLAACAGALLFTLPLSCYYFGGFSLLLPVANLLMVASAGWALLWGWLGMLLCLCPPLSLLGQPLLYGAGILSRYLAWAADWLGPDGAFVPVYDTWHYLLLISLCLLLAVGICWRLPWRRVTAACLTLAVLTVAVGYPLTVSVTRLSVIKADDAAALLVRRGAHSALLISHSSGLRDVAYDLQDEGCTRLDAIVVAEGEPMDAAALKELADRTGSPALYTADSREWEAFSGLSLSRLEVGDALPVWEGCRMTRLTEEWWRVDTAGGSVLLGAGETPPPQTAALTVYTALPEALPDTPCVLVCSEYRLAEERPQLTDKTYWLSRDSITYITRPGKEWSVSPWL